MIRRWPAGRLPLAPGRVNGELGAAAGRLEDNTSLLIYEIAAKPGQHWTFDLRSADFDPIVAVVDPQGIMAATNDDKNSKLGTSSFLGFDPEAEGTYQVWVTSSAPGEGDFTLAVAVEERKEASTVLALGQPASGWLAPGDRKSPQGAYFDAWSFTLPGSPVLLRLSSPDFDTRLEAVTPERAFLINDDTDQVGGDHDSTILVTPGPGWAEGAVLRLNVTSSGPAAAIGRYHISAQPLPVLPPGTATVTLRPVLVRGAEGKGGTEVTPEQARTAIERAGEIWKACGVDVRLENAEIRAIEVAGFEGVVQVVSDTWTPAEIALQTHPARAPFSSGVLTVFVVRETDGGENHGLAYPATRYAPGRTGILLGSKRTEPAYLGNILAHEIGHVLGLNHAEAVDGDPGNDGAANLMNTASGDVPPEATFSPLQCRIARSSPSFLSGSGAGGADGLVREDKILRPGAARQGALGGGDATMSPGHYLDVYYFTGQAGETVEIGLTSDELDPHLLLDGPDGERLTQDDDGGGGLAALLRVTLPAGGDYAVGVTSAFPQTGSYSLTFSRASPPRAPASR